MFANAESSELASTAATPTSEPVASPPAAPPAAPPAPPNCQGGAGGVCVRWVWWGCSGGAVGVRWGCRARLPADGMSVACARRYARRCARAGSRPPSRPPSCLPSRPRPAPSRPVPPPVAPLPSHLDKSNAECKERKSEPLDWRDGAAEEVHEKKRSEERLGLRPELDAGSAPGQVWGGGEGGEAPYPHTGSRATQPHSTQPMARDLVARR
jgi:hypothetical protein